MRFYIYLIAALVFLIGLFSAVNVHAQGISQLQQFTSTTSPAAAITQTVYGKAFRLSGQSSGCAQFSANGTLTSTGVSCGTGSGSSFAYPLPSNATSTSIAFNGGLTGVLTGSLVGNASTATALAADGTNCSAGNANLGIDASGNAQNCFDVWTEAENTAAAYIASVTADSPLSGSGTSASHLTISAADNTHSGYVAANDYKLIHTATTTFSAPFVYTASTNAVTCTGASSGITGCLTGTDWNTFNGKQAAGNYITALTSDVTASGPGSVAATIAANAVTYAKFQTVAANSLVGNNTGASANTAAVATSTLFGSPTAGQILAFLNGQNSWQSTTTLNIGGNSNTATSLASTPTKCSAGNYPLGIDASGNAQNCTAAAGSSFAYPFPSNATSTLISFNGNASTTASSVFQKAFFGATATTTIDSTGNVVVPSGSNLTITGKSDGCATFATGVLNSTGSACGSAGGGSPGGTGTNLQYRVDASTFGGVSNSAFLVNGNVGIGSTTPWALLSVASTTYDYLNPLFSVATSTDKYGQILYATATSSVLTTIVNAITGAVLDIGARVSVGLSQYLGGGLLDQFTVAGRINTQGWSYIACDAPGATAASNASNICNGWGYGEAEPVAGMSVTILPTTAVNAGYSYYRLSGLATANNIGALYAGPSALGGAWLSAPTSTPVMEASFRFGNSVGLAMSTSTAVIGFVSTLSNAASISAPTDGCYFTASSTQLDWRAIARNSNAETNVDTKVASTTDTTNGLSGFRRFRIEADNTHCDFYIQNGQTASLVKVASVNTNIPTTVALNATVTAGNTGSAISNLAPVADVMRLRLWWRDFLPAK